MNKTTLKIILALLILLALWQSGRYLNGRNRFQQYIDLPPEGEYDISIQYHVQQGMNLQVTDQADQQAIIQTVNSLTYAGHTPNVSISPNDEVYSLVIFPTQQHKETVIIYLSDKVPCYIQDNNIGLKIGNPENLQQLVSQIYTKISKY